MSLKILVVDDEPQIRKQLSIGLSGYGYTVNTADHGQAALIAIAQHPPDLVILDISLGTPPDGIEVCHRLREWSKIPVIMLSVHNEEKIKVKALNAGADDYLTKPFGMEELHARIQAVLRRITSEQPSVSPKSEIRVGALSIDMINRLVRVDDQEVHLTPKEYELLRLLATHPGKVLTHRVILNAVWGTEYGEMDHYVRVFVNQLRKKLRENPTRNIRYILNEPGIGYRFVGDDPT
ncbi:MAG: response regulator transcription factor [Anaerolineae bacterium]|jgi:two-component system KDP operon response regulator KdpE|nr:response regulator transcription factor [Anaerolineae bacterium]